MKVSNEVMAVLSAARVEGAQLFLTGQLDRKLYEQTNKVLEAAGGKWNRKAKAHVFEADASERIDQIILTGDIVIPKDEFEFFPTPEPLVRKMIERADIRDGMMVLEPSAGRGAIALAAYKAASGVLVDMFELMEENNRYLALELDLPLCGVAKPCDFLTAEPTPIYDRVLMNPPFSKGQDVKHVTHALEFLKPGGRLVAIMSAGVTFRQDKRTTEFRALVDFCNGTIEPNPEDSFKSSGTGVNTVMVTMQART